MRILSQDGKCDYPYEQAGLSIAWSNDRQKFYISCHYKLQDNGVKIASYSTEEKAQKAMEMLRKAYSPILVIQEQDDAIKPNIKPNDWLSTPALPDTKIEVMDNFYFQFPQDNEIE